MAPKLFNTGFLENDFKLRQKQGLPIQEFGGQCNNLVKYSICNKHVMYPIQNFSVTYGPPCSCSKNPNIAMASMKI